MNGNGDCRTGASTQQFRSPVTCRFVDPVQRDDAVEADQFPIGVPPSFDTWYRHEHPRLVATLLLVTGDLGIAVESVDEAFARALERWDRVSAMGSPAGWTFQVARNLCRRAQRRAAMERRLLLRSTRSAAVPAPAGEIWELVAVLPARQREAIVLRHIADLREEEIAAALGVSRSTVSTTLRTAHERLARKLRETEEEMHDA